MRVASIFCPSFSTISIPLGIVYINTRLAALGHAVETFDFELFLDLVDPDFNEALHHFIIYPSVEEEENGRVLFINRLDTLLETLYGDEPPVDAHPILEPLLRYANAFATLLVDRGFETVLFSTYNSNLFFSLVVAQAIKRRAPSTKTIFGGPAVSFPQVYAFLIGTRLCDYCVVGEGETTIAELIAALDTRSGSDRGPLRVPGVAYWNGLQVSYEDRAKMDLATTLNTPSYDGFPFDGARPHAYSTKTGYFALPISASRGCTLRCAFCAETNFWENFRSRDPIAVVEEMAALSETYQSRVFHVCDSLINADVGWLERFCDALERVPRPGFLINFAYCQARNLTEPLINKMARAGFRALNFGVESGSDPLLKKMHKATKSASIHDIVIWSLRAGLNIDFPLLRNLPGETREDVWNSLSFVSNLEDAIARENPPGGLTYSADTNFRLEAMSGIFRKPEHYGLTLTHFDAPLPAGAKHIEHLIRPMRVRWTNDVTPNERRVRSLAMMSMKRVRPIQKYSVEECLEWVDLRYGYVLAPNVRVTDDDDRGGQLTTRFGAFQIGRPEVSALRFIEGGQARARVPADGADPRVLARRLGWSDDDVTDLLANLLAIGAIRSGGSAYLLGSKTWPALLEATGKSALLAPQSASAAGDPSSVGTMASP